jgi:hypothetical protein
LFFAKKYFTDVLGHCREGETNCWFSILGTFPSYRVPEATKDVNVHFFIQSYYATDITAANFCELYQRFPGKFWIYYVCRQIGKPTGDRQIDREDKAIRHYVCENVPKRDSFVQNLMLKKAEKGYFVN